jgi:hypothetical protein
MKAPKSGATPSEIRRLIRMIEEQGPDSFEPRDFPRPYEKAILIEALDLLADMTERERGVRIKAAERGVTVQSFPT